MVSVEERPVAWPVAWPRRTKEPMVGSREKLRAPWWAPDADESLRERPKEKESDARRVNERPKEKESDGASS